MAVIRHAVENAVNGPKPDDTRILAILAGAPADGAWVRAIFGDVAMQTLMQVAAAHHIPHATMLAAYVAARAQAAVNPELDRLIDDPW